MDSRKRKISNATPVAGEGGGSASKKIKLLNSNPAPSQPDGQSTVQKVGQKVLAQLNNATDKHGRSVADAFIELPPRDELPEYYQQIRMPVALDTIEYKLKQNAYPTVTSLESDLKRMIQNAKEYNVPKSEIYEDAERIRKLVYNFMKVHNPAYSQDPSYTSFPTPYPEPKLTLTNNANRVEGVKEEPKSRDGSVKPRPSTAPKASEPPSERNSSIAASSGREDVDGDDEEDENMDFTGKSFQDAQQMIIAELIRHTDEEGLEIFTPFVNLPTRRLEDYYKTIKHPVSLKGVQKRIKGIHGRAPPTGITDFKTWDAFEDEVSFIWRNAREFNQDGSDMYNLAGEFEEYFKMRLAEAKEKVEEPAGTRIKLGGPKPPSKSGITLNLSQHRNSPTPGVSVDNEALARQRLMVQAGVNGHQAQNRHRPPTMNGVAPAASPMGNGIRPAMGAQAGSPPAAAMKNEKLAALSPAPPTYAPAVQPYTNGMMPPPVARPLSGSPFPVPSSGYQPNSFHYTAPAALPPTAIRSYPVSQALLPTVTISTHPYLKLAKPYSIAIPPHPSLSQQSTTITLPSSHYYLQISPTISRDLSMGRAYKMFVTVNGSRLTQRDTQFHADSGKRTHVYEGSLAAGVNRIEVEVAAAKVGDADGKGLDVEKLTVFANLTRQ